MARTRQTARRSTGGRAPRRQLATYPARRQYATDTDAEAVWSRQVQIYNETECRTIAVEGSAELAETPDVIRLSFLVSEDNAITLKDGIGKVVDKIRQVREAVTALGVSNDSISSDSISAKKKKIDYGDYDDEGDFKVHESKITFHVKSVVRICLGDEGQEGKVEQQEHNVPDIQELFSKVCFAMTARLGINMQEAPNYELSDINELRNEARKGACENARLKATSMVDAMGENSKVKLGDPITITDIPVDLSDDAGQSFLGNDMDLHSYDTIRVVESTEERSRKRARREAIEPMDDEDKNNDGEEVMGNMGSLDEETASQLFVVPSIKIAARVRAVFATS